MSTPEATEEGKRRYPPDGLYRHEAFDGGVASCTCEPACPARCAGECGCEVCSFTFVDFCDEAGLLGVDGLQVSEGEALRLYRSSSVA